MRAQDTTLGKQSVQKQESNNDQCDCGLHSMAVGLYVFFCLKISKRWKGNKFHVLQKNTKSTNHKK